MHGKMSRGDDVVKNNGEAGPDKATVRKIGITLFDDLRLCEAAYFIEAFHADIALIRNDQRMSMGHEVHVGVTPHPNFLILRLEMRRMLVKNMLPVDTITRRCGIDTGTAPAELLRKHRAQTLTGYRAGRVRLKEARPREFSKRSE
ncbi:hypothetical protein B0G73_13652 [Paraburkholderia sp. BL25I1N1]|nr:hypothetical protein B0G73_13652 [Paraburkholderia sp. BL25I1N1]